MQSNCRSYVAGDNYRPTSCIVLPKYGILSFLDQIVVPEFAGRRRKVNSPPLSLPLPSPVGRGREGEGVKHETRIAETRV